MTPAHRPPAMPRLFALRRHVDFSGVSGTGIVAYGTQYPPDGAVTVAWLGRTTGHPSMGIYPSLTAVTAIHGHDGGTDLPMMTGSSETAWLNVFGSNLAAITLYETAGYQVTSQRMAKDLH
ncbi:MAG: hypothetical protein ACRDUA_15360 [Micromonosporaceae bacterium]